MAAANRIAASVGYLALAALLFEVGRVAMAGWRNQTAVKVR